MQRASRWIVTGFAAISFIAVAGCADHPADNNNNGTMAGGNGSFDTSPDRPGAHNRNLNGPSDAGDTNQSGSMNNGMNGPNGSSTNGQNGQNGGM